MTDLVEMLDSVAGGPASPSPHDVADDIRRGRRALIRRRWTRGAMAVVAAAAVVAGSVVASPRVDSNDAGVTVHAAGPVADDPPNPGADLVAYDGPLHGALFKPAEVPDGWTVSGDARDLLISPPGSSPTGDRQDLVDFRGKILVYLDNGIPNEPLPRDAEVQVGDRTGYANRADASALQVWVPLPNGQALRAQAPLSTGWDEATLGRFLGGVTVLKGAKGTNG